MTQATLSRDIKELGLMKRAADGAYQPAPDDDPSTPATDVARHNLQRALVDYLAGIEQSQQLLVLRTGAGRSAAAGPGHRSRQAARRARDDRR